MSIKLKMAIVYFNSLIGQISGKPCQTVEPLLKQKVLIKEVLVRDMP